MKDLRLLKSKKDDTLNLRQQLSS